MPHWLAYMLGMALYLAIYHDATGIWLVPVPIHIMSLAVLDWLDW